MRPSTRLALGGAAAMTLIAQVGLVSAGAASTKDSEARQFQTEPTRTGKERLGGKASDEQRVDNCKVPLDLRGPTARPDACEDGASAKPMR